MGKVGRTAIRIGILASVLWLSGTGARAAQEEEEPVQAESGTALFGIPAPTREDLEEEGALVSERYFDGDSYLKGLFDSCTGYFNAGDWEISRAVFVMEYSASNLLDHAASYVTVYVNSEPVATQYLPEGAGEEQRMVLELPPGSIQKDEVNSVTVEAYLRGRDADACVDETSVGTWLNVYQESKVLIAYQPLTEVTSIAAFYTKFSSIEAMDYGMSAVAVQQGADEAELTAMAQVLTGVSRNMAQSYEKTICRLLAPGEDMSAPYTVFICGFDRLPPELADSLSPEQKKEAKESALVCLLPNGKEQAEGEQAAGNGQKEYGQSDRTGAILLLTGSDSAAMENAGRMLANEEFRRQLTQQTRQVGKEEFRMESQGVEEYVSLTDYGLQVKGLFRKTANFTVEYPANRRLAAASQLSLDYRYSKNIDFEKSLLTVYWNQVPVGSRRLTEEEADGATALFDIPPDLETAGAFQVEVVFDLYPEDENWCSLSPDEIPWGYVAQTSMLKLVSDGEAPYDFEHYPAPFVKDGSLSKVKVLLPEEPGEEDIRVMGGILLTLGRYLKDNNGDITVSPGIPADLASCNLIAIGAASRNGLLQQNRETLAAACGEETAAASGRVLTDPWFARTAGGAQLAESPYSETPRAILFVSGSGKEEMAQTLAYLGDTQELKQLEGDVFLTDGEQLLCYREGAAEPEQETAKPAGEGIRPGESTESAYLILGAVTLLICLAAAMLAVKYRRKDRDEK